MGKSQPIIIFLANLGKEKEKKILSVNVIPRKKVEENQNTPHLPEHSATFT